MLVGKGALALAKQVVVGGEIPLAGSPGDLGGDSGEGDQERELGPLSAEWPGTGPPPWPLLWQPTDLLFSVSSSPQGRRS